MAWRYGNPTRRKQKGRPSKFFYVRRYDPDSQAQAWVNTGLAKKADAVAFVEKLRVDAALGVTPDESPTDVTFAYAFEAWLAEKEGRITDVYFRTLKYRGESYWRPFFGAMRLREVTRDVVNDYLRKRQAGALDRPRKSKKKRPPQPRPGRKSAATMNSDLVALREFFKYTRSRKWIDESPAEDIRRFAGAMKRRVRSLTDEEEARLIEACRTGPKLVIAATRNAGGTHGGKSTKNKIEFEQTAPPPPHLAPLVVTALGAGFRKRTLLSLSWKHVDFDSGWWRIPAELMKTTTDYVAHNVLSELHRYRADLATSERPLQQNESATYFSITVAVAAEERADWVTSKERDFFRALRRGETGAAGSNHRVHWLTRADAAIDVAQGHSSLTNLWNPRFDLYSGDHEGSVGWETRVRKTQFWV